MIPHSEPLVLRRDGATADIRAVRPDDAPRMEEIAELDLNAVIALPRGQGALAADTRIRVPRQTTGPS